jgi:hypothetical protein
VLVFVLFLFLFYFIFYFYFFLIAENWLHASGEPSNWQITQANRYYTSLKLRLAIIVDKKKKKTLCETCALSACAKLWGVDTFTAKDRDFL